MIVATLVSAAGICASVLLAARLIASAVTFPNREVERQVEPEPEPLPEPEYERRVENDPVPVGGHTPRVRRL